MASAIHTPTCVLIAGPNGAGKSTFYQLRLQPIFPDLPFINADDIQRLELRDTREGSAYEAAEIAARRREDRIAERRSFVTETVFSHPSKFELLRSAKDAGYTVVVFHIGVETADLSAARVAHRVSEDGGHGVPEDKIRQRFLRNPSLIRAAVLSADHAMVFDNSGLNDGFRFALGFVDGTVVRIGDHVAPWVQRVYADELDPVSSPQR